MIEKLRAGMVKSPSVKKRVSIERVPIASLKLDPKNVRKHGKRNLAAITKSLERFGQQKPIVVDADGIVLAGNGTLEAARSLGWTDIDAVRTALKGSAARAYAVADNQTAALAEWDEPGLVELLDGLKREEEALFLSTGFDDREFAQMLARMGRDLEDESATPDPPADPQTRPGDLWILGRPRVLCGDSTKAEDAGRLLGDARPGLMVTDPPYGVDYDPEWREGIDWSGKRRTGVVNNDDRADWTPAYQLFPGSVCYVWHGGLHASEVQGNLLAAELTVRAQIIWAKQNQVFSRGAYHWKHEPCWYAVRRGATAKWAGDRKQATLWEIKNLNPMGGNLEEDKTNHSTQKPVECMARPMRNHDFPEVYDPFLGSGTTLIAAEQLGRVCYGIEIEPRYCDVVLQRWYNLTGQIPRREDGTEFKPAAKA